MRQAGPDHMQDEDTTQPQQDLCTITKSGRGTGACFSLQVNDRSERQEEGKTTRTNPGNTPST